VQIYDQKADLSMPAWYSHANLLLRLINSIYVCRLVSSHIGPEAFSDIFGGQEQRILPCLHATLIASLAIISIVGGNQNAETLVESILWAATESCKSIPEVRTTDLQVVNGKKCACESHSLHKRLTPIAAAKAIGMDVWRKRKLIKMPVNRVWDLVADRLVQDMDVRNVVFISHRWLDGKVAKEVEYEKLKTKRMKNQ
jgi:hypothetical protein